MIEMQWSFERGMRVWRYSAGSDNPTPIVTATVCRQTGEDGNNCFVPIVTFSQMDDDGYAVSSEKYIALPDCPTLDVAKEMAEVYVSPTKNQNQTNMEK